jgi:flagellar basal body-associated protein FliL
MLKSQSLPISTIVIIVISIVVLSAVLLFFFSGFGKPSNTLSEQEALSRCQSRCSIISASNPTTSDKVTALASSDKVNYCENITVNGEVKQCPEITKCYVESAKCTLSCSGDTPGCS